MDQDHGTPAVARSTRPFAELATSARRRASLSIEELAPLVGVSAVVVAAWEAGEVFPAPSVLFALTEKLELGLVDVVAAIAA